MRIVGIYPDGDIFRVATVKGTTSIIHSVDEAPIGRALALPGVIVRQFDAPLKKRQLLSTLPYQLDETLPYPIEDRLLGAKLREGGATVFIGSKKKLDHLVDEMRPMWVSSVASALFRYVKESFEVVDNLYFFEGKVEAFALEIKEGVIQRFLQLAKPVSKERILSFFECDQLVEISDPFAISHGLVLEATAKDGASLEFLTGKQRHPKIRRELKLRQCFVGALFLSLALFTGFLLESRLWQKELAYQAGFEALSLEIPELKAKRTLGGVQKQLRKFEKGNALFDSPPKVANLFLHLEKITKPLELSRIETFLEEKPYRMRVELSFKAPSAAVAENFHEYLMSGDEMIDKGRDIQWSRTSHGYETAFYLKS